MTGISSLTLTLQLCWQSVFPLLLLHLSALLRADIWGPTRRPWRASRRWPTWWWTWWAGSLLISPNICVLYMHDDRSDGRLFENTCSFVLCVLSYMFICCVWNIFNDMLSMWFPFPFFKNLSQLVLAKGFNSFGHGILESLIKS